MRASFSTTLIEMSPSVGSRSSRLWNASVVSLLAPIGTLSPSHACSRESSAFGSTNSGGSGASSPAADRVTTSSRVNSRSSSAGTTGEGESASSLVRTTARSSTTKGRPSTAAAVGSTWVTSRHSGTYSAMASCGTDRYAATRSGGVASYSAATSTPAAASTAGRSWMVGPVPSLRATQSSRKHRLSVRATSRSNPSPVSRSYSKPVVVVTRGVAPGLIDAPR